MCPVPLQRGPRAVRQVLDGTSAAMNAEDKLAARRADPIGYVRAQQWRNTLLGRLLYTRAHRPAWWLEQGAGDQLAHPWGSMHQIGGLAPMPGS
jgi:hypothetical protein